MDSLRARNLRIVQWADRMPLRAACTRCERIFTVTDPSVAVSKTRGTIWKFNS